MRPEPSPLPAEPEPSPLPAEAAGPSSGIDARREVPGTVTAAATLAGAEAVVLVGYAVTYTVQVLPLGDEALTRGLIAGGVVLFLSLMAVAIASAAWALLHLRHWPRSLLLVVQLLAVAVMVPLALAGIWIAWLVVAAAVCTAALVLAPPTTAAIER